jgi:soluble lytic murein transglycosylase-like protein
LNPKLLLCILCVSLLAMPRLSLSHDYCFEEAGKQYEIAPVLLWAISKEESRFNPYAINFNRNGSYDYCHMQINSSWVYQIGENAWASLGDPCQCTKVGAWILSQCIRDHGYSWEAVGCYHAKNSHKRVLYSWKIQEALNKQNAINSVARAR